MSFSKAFLLLLASNALAAPAKEADIDDGGVLHMPLIQIPVELDSTNSHEKRQAATGLDRWIYDRKGRSPLTALGVVLNVGTPPQKVLVEPDTGSSKLWVPGIGPNESRDPNQVSIFFDPSASKSMKDFEQVDGERYHSTRVEYNVISDHVAVGDVSVGRVKFGVGNMSSPHTNMDRRVGVLGLHPGATKNNVFILDALKARKAIKTRAFSMGVRKEGRGTLAIGGYDASKFTGVLEKIPMVPTKNDHYAVAFKAFSVSTNKGTGPKHSRVLFDEKTVENEIEKLTIGIDSGAPAFVIRSAAGSVLERKLRGQWSTASGRLEIPCRLADLGLRFDFVLTDKTTISVPIADFVVSRNNDMCGTVIQRDDEVPTSIWIGGHFLRRSFVVFDPDEKALHIARGADCGSTMMPINGPLSDEIVGKCEDADMEKDLAAQHAPESSSPPRTEPKLMPDDASEPVDNCKRRVPQSDSTYNVLARLRE